jgi:large subunit ribosomal protein L18
MPKRFKTFVTQHRRRREGRTDYKQRLSLLKSGEARIVIRRSANGVTCQIVKHDKKGDKTLITVGSKELKKAGWKAHTGNTPAAYLTGLLCAVDAKKKKISSAVLDLGLHTSTKGSRIYAALKGAVDGGLKVPHSADVIPDERRISGAHVAEYAKKLKSEKPEDYKKQFSGYIKSKVVPEDLAKHFDELKKKILK